MFPVLGEKSTGSRKTGPVVAQNCMGTEGSHLSGQGLWSRGNLRERRSELDFSRQPKRRVRQLGSRAASPLQWPVLKLNGRSKGRKYFLLSKCLTAQKIICLFFPLQIVNSDTALKFLQSLKYSYTKQELLESELAVLKTLHFQINMSTPLAYVELLLEVLGKSINRREWERIF